MRGIVPPDPETDVSKISYGVVYIPRRNRNRFPANCVEIFDSKEAALKAADPTKKRFAALVSGPSRSSEGLSLYYLIEWLRNAKEITSPTGAE